MSEASTRVGIALVERSGRYLVRRRPDVPGSPMPGRWEFPGGKAMDDESAGACAVRECREESGLAGVAAGVRMRVVHRYPHGLVELNYVDVSTKHDAEPAEGSGFAWVAAADLPGLDFPEANGPILAELARGT